MLSSTLYLPDSRIYQLPWWRPKLSGILFCFGWWIINDVSMILVPPSSESSSPKDKGITLLRTVSNYIPVEDGPSEKDLHLNLGFFFMHVINVQVFACFSIQNLWHLNFCKILLKNSHVPRMWNPTHKEDAYLHKHTLLCTVELHLSGRSISGLAWPFG